MEDRPLSALVKELITSMSALIRSEINLAKVEVKNNARDAGKQIAKSAVGGVLAWIGVQCLVVFAIIGLGRLLDGRYWLSSLIVGLLFAIPGALLALRGIKAMKEDTDLPVLRRNLEHDREMLNQKVYELRTETRRPIVATTNTEVTGTGSPDVRAS